MKQSRWLRKSFYPEDVKKILFSVLIILGMSLFSFLVFRYYSMPGTRISHDGRMDLSGYQFEQQGVLSLNGEWSFQWKEESAARKFPRYGYAVYLLKIKGLKGTYSLALNPCSTAYRFYMNGELAAASGEMGNHKSEAVPSYQENHVLLRADGGETDLTCVVSNYSHIRGGIWFPVLLGTEQQIRELNQEIELMRIFVVGSISIVLIFSGAAFILGTRDKPLIMMIFLSAGSIISTLFYQNYTILNRIRSFHVTMIMEYSMITLLPVLILAFVSEVIHGRLNRIEKTIVKISVLLFWVTVITPVSFFTQLLTGFVIWDIFILLYMLVSIMKSGFPYRLPLFTGMMMMGILGIADYLYQTSWLNLKCSIFPFGFFILIVTDSIIINLYYQDMLRENQKNYETAKAMELSFLNSQIKPHFLYNTLGAIANVCEKDGEKGSELILDLASVLRNKLEFSDFQRMVTLQQEMDFIWKYVHIVQARYGDKIRLETKISVPPDVQVPVLVLEPLVENAILHGIAQKKEGGTVCIEVREKGRKIYAEVKDNGVGMTKEKCRAVLQDASSGVGLSNINWRLTRMFGQGLQIYSEEGEGTTVLFCMERKSEK